MRTSFRRYMNLLFGGLVLLFWGANIGYFPAAMLGSMILCFLLWSATEIF